MPPSEPRTPSGTVTLTSAEDATLFEAGAVRRIDDMTEEEACAVFGRPVYESWLRTKDRPGLRGTVTIVSIDKERPLAKITSMLGDCDNCGHSIMYHLPLAGCVKCSCEEFS